MRSVEEVTRLLTGRLEASWHRWLTDPTQPAEPSATPTPLASTASPDISSSLNEAVDRASRRGDDVGESRDGTGSDGAAAGTPWPMAVPLGRPTQQVLNSSFAEPNRWAIRWRDTAAAAGLVLRWQDRSVSGSRQPMPTHLVLAGPQDVARVAGENWERALAQGRVRWELLRRLFPTTATPAVLRATQAVDDTTFELLLRSATWLRAHDTTGLTARQVPIEGTHAKWLQSHQAVLLALSGKVDLGLVSRPTRIGFTYLDPEHRAPGRRRHDSYTLGDTALPAYPPSVAVISENKDTAVMFNPLAGGISVEGGGDAAARQLPAVAWLTKVPLVLYWGDIDADGFEIVNALRAAGLAVHSMLMDIDTYERYEAFGSWTDQAGRQLGPSPAKALPWLTDNERELYRSITDPAWTRVRRIEQERISLDTASVAVQVALDRFRTVATLL